MNILPNSVSTSRLHKPIQHLETSSIYLETHPLSKGDLPMLNIRFVSSTYQTLLARANKEGTSIPRLVVKLVEDALKAGY